MRGRARIFTAGNSCGGAVRRAYLINWDQLQIVFICGTFTSIAKRFKQAQNKALNTQQAVAIELHKCECTLVPRPSEREAQWD
jgi:hypothetical protein